MIKETAPNSASTWLTYLNPNAEIGPGIVAKKCADWCPKGKSQPNNRNIACGFEMAYAAAGYILKGSTVEEEKAELRRFMKTYVGRQVVNPSSNEIETLKTDGVNSFVENVVGIGTKLAEASRFFSENSKTFTPSVVDNLPHSQRLAVFEVHEANNKITNMRRGENPQPLLENMQKGLKQAIDVGLHEYGLIIRQSVAYGVGNYLRNRLPVDSPVTAQLEAITGSFPDQDN